MKEEKKERNLKKRKYEGRKYERWEWKKKIRKREGAIFHFMHPHDHSHAASLSCPLPPVLFFLPPASLLSPSVFCLLFSVSYLTSCLLHYSLSNFCCFPTPSHSLSYSSPFSSVFPLLPLLFFFCIFASSVSPLPTA